LREIQNQDLLRRGDGRLVDMANKKEMGNGRLVDEKSENFNNLDNRLGSHSPDVGRQHLFDLLTMVAIKP